MWASLEDCGGGYGMESRHAHVTLAGHFIFIGRGNGLVASLPPSLAFP